jgi:hypothetical protein
MMQQLNLPSYEFRIIKENDRFRIFDPVRKRFVSLTPEEWVRQNFLRYLVEEKGYPLALTAVEKRITLNGKNFRFDLVVYRRNGQPFLIAEFKAPEVKITQDAFDQVVRYNMALKVERVVVSNGLQHYVCEIDYLLNRSRYLTEVPNY